MDTELTTTKLIVLKKQTFFFHDNITKMLLINFVATIIVIPTSFLAIHSDISDSGF